jgi:hypothetical protein
MAHLRAAVGQSQPTTWIESFMPLPSSKVEPGTPVYITQRYGSRGKRRGTKTVGTIIRDLGGSLEVRTDGGQAYFSRTELSILSEPLHPLFPMRAKLPYGKWTCADGKEVLFNRDYEPIWERLPGEMASAADRKAQYEHVKEKWFFGDRNPPWSSERSVRRCLEALRVFGVPNCSEETPQGKILNKGILESIRG